LTEGKRQSTIEGESLWDRLSREKQLQGKLAANLPAQLLEALPCHTTDAQRAIALVQSLPVISAGLVGMKQIEHLEENLGAAAGQDRDE